MRKKFMPLIGALLAVIMTVTPSFAAGAADWTAGNGFLIDNKNSAVVIKDTADGVQVTHGGYYTDGVNWGGVASKNKYKLDGLSLEIVFNTITKNSDCWISIGFMEKPELFKTGNIPGNRGYTNLIRFGSDPIAWQHIEAIDKWGIAKSQNVDFKMDNGTTLKMEVKKDGGNYVFTLNGVKADYTFSKYADIFKNDEAYIVIGASAKDSTATAFTYTIKSINGKSVAATSAAASAATTKAASSTTTKAAQTGDMSAIISIGLIALSSSSVLVLRRKRSK